MLLLTSLQGWGLVGIIAFWARMVRNASRVQAPSQSWSLRRISGHFFWAPIDCAATGGQPFKDGLSSVATIVLIAPIAFCDRLLFILAGAIPSALQASFYALQAASALGITLGLGLIVLSLFRLEQQTR